MVECYCIVNEWSKVVTNTIVILLRLISQKYLVVNLHVMWNFASIHVQKLGKYISRLSDNFSWCFITTIFDIFKFLKKKIDLLFLTNWLCIIIYFAWGYLNFLITEIAPRRNIENSQSTSTDTETSATDEKNSLAMQLNSKIRIASIFSISEETRITCKGNKILAKRKKKLPLVFPTNILRYLHILKQFWYKWEKWNFLPLYILCKINFIWLNIHPHNSIQLIVVHFCPWSCCHVATVCVTSIMINVKIKHDHVATVRNFDHVVKINHDHQPCAWCNCDHFALSPFNKNQKLKKKYFYQNEDAISVFQSFNFDDYQMCVVHVVQKFDSSTNLKNFDFHN